MDHYDKPVAKYKVNSTIKSSDVDCFHELKMNRAFQLFQDSANEHSTNLDLSVNNLADRHGVAWILMRMRVEAIKMPLRDDDICIETWPLPSSPMYERDFIIYDKNGDPLLKCGSVWIIMDMESRNIIRDRILKYEHIEMLTDRAVGGKLKQLREPGPLERVYDRLIHYTDIDYNGHVNNTRYVEYCYDCLDLSFYERNRVSAFEINFVNECMTGETIVLYKALYPESACTGLCVQMFYIEGRCASDDRIIFKSKIEVASR